MTNEENKNCLICNKILTLKNKPGLTITGWQGKLKDGTEVCWDCFDHIRTIRVLSTHKFKNFFYRNLPRLLDEIIFDMGGLYFWTLEDLNKCGIFSYRQKEESTYEL